MSLRRPTPLDRAWRSASSVETIGSLTTLFSPKILTFPPPIPEPPPEPSLSPFLSTPVDSVDTSNQSSLGTSSILTQDSQDQPRIDVETSYTHGQPQVPPPGSRGNPKLLFMGLKRCGKSSIQKVVFQKLPPADTLYLESTAKIETAAMQTFIHFESAEVPAQYSYLSPEDDHTSLFANIGAAIWIIDSQDEYLTSINELLRTAVFLVENYPRVNLEVFIHKTDGLGDEYRYDTFREVRQRVQDELSDYGYGDRSVSYYQTSIFDHSIFEAMSKVIQRLLPQLPAMERLLTTFCSTCRIQKAYLFDTVSKIYIATDASPTRLKDYEVCSDYVDIVVDFKQLYGWNRQSADGRPSSQSSVDVGFVGESIVTSDRSGDAYIFAREVNEFLSLICIMGKGSSVDKRMLIDYNVDIVRDALLQVFKIEEAGRDTPQFDVS